MFTSDEDERRRSGILVLLHTVKVINGEMIINEINVKFMWWKMGLLFLIFLLHIHNQEMGLI